MPDDWLYVQFYWIVISPMNKERSKEKNKPLNKKDKEKLR